uniref:Uncharacterized protein n=1 Tax=Acanthochromis polyacanthus TaxID=80966 RepID=A0A3Q1G9Y7_9TELE
MSKRRSSSANEHPSKRSRPEQEEEGEDDENVCTSEVVSDAGIVESITLKNFMCHSLLGPFAFGSNVNFVVGNNGSNQ